MGAVVHAEPWGPLALKTVNALQSSRRHGEQYPFGDANHLSIAAKVAHPHPFSDPLQQGFHAIQSGFDGGQAWRLGL